MAEASIPVDLLNPGQVFACLGLMEAAEVLLGDAEAGFDWSHGEARFTLRASGEEDPVRHVLGFLMTAEVAALAPPKNYQMKPDKDTAKYIRLNVRDQDPYPVPAPKPAELKELPSREALPIVLKCPKSGLTITVAYWGEVPRVDPYKQWSGTGGKTGAGIAHGILRKIPRDIAEKTELDPFAEHSELSNGFRMDFRRDYVALDAGFSPNEHSGKNSIEMVGYPVVEILAAIGLSHARPFCTDNAKRMRYRYGVVGGTPLPPMFVRAALGGFAPPVPGRPWRTFEMRLGYASQEGKAHRCITDVREETSDDPDA